MMPHTPPPLVLASSSPYRRALLNRLCGNFSCASPAIDESPRPGEGADALVARLAEAKARALATRFPDALIIGSDQVASVGTQLLTKPGNRARALEQLTLCAGRTVRFSTGLCVLDAGSGEAATVVEPFAVTFRPLDQGDIATYIDRERPYDCAGAFKAEGLGIALFSALKGRDPTALIGLPLIALCDLLRARGLNPLALDD